MGRVMAIDFGKVRTGIAVTDPLKIFASALDTINTPKLMEFLRQYLIQEPVEIIVIGDGRQDDGSPGHISDAVEQLKKILEEAYPAIQIALHEEHYSSKRAREIIFQSGKGKKSRRDKKLVDKVAASLILQDYMDSNNLW